MTDEPRDVTPEPPKRLMRALMQVFKDVHYARPNPEGWVDQDEIYRLFRSALQDRGVHFAPSATLVSPIAPLVVVACRFEFTHVTSGESKVWEWPGGSADDAEAGQVTKALAGATVSFFRTMFMVRQGEGIAADEPGELRLRTGGRGAGDGTASPKQREAILSKQEQIGISDFALLWMIHEVTGQAPPTVAEDDKQAIGTALTGALNMLQARHVGSVWRQMSRAAGRRRRAA